MRATTAVEITTVNHKQDLNHDDHDDDHDHDDHDDHDDSWGSGQIKLNSSLFVAWKYISLHHFRKDILLHIIRKDSFVAFLDFVSSYLERDLWQSESHNLRVTIWDLWQSEICDNLRVTIWDLSQSQSDILGVTIWVKIWENAPMQFQDPEGAWGDQREAECQDERDRGDQSSWGCELQGC